MTNQIKNMVLRCRLALTIIMLISIRWTHVIFPGGGEVEREELERRGSRISQNFPLSNQNLFAIQPQTNRPSQPVKELKENKQKRVIIGMFY